MNVKNNSCSLLYEIGMIVTSCGFIFPVFKNTMRILDKSVVFYSIRIFDFLTKDDPFRSLLLLLILICSVAGLIVSFLSIEKKTMIKAAILTGSIFCGILFSLLTSDIFKQYHEYFYIGLYCIIAGWIFSIIGILNIKVTKK